MKSKTLSRQEFVDTFVNDEHEVGKVEMMGEVVGEHGFGIGACCTYRGHSASTFEAGDVVVVHEYPGNPHGPAAVDPSDLRAGAVWLCGEDGQMHQYVRQRVDQRSPGMVDHWYYNHFKPLIHGQFIDADKHVDRAKVIAYVNMHLAQGVAA